MGTTELGRRIDEFAYTEGRSALTVLDGAWEGRCVRNYPRSACGGRRHGEVVASASGADLDGVIDRASFETRPHRRFCRPHLVQSGPIL